MINYQLIPVKQVLLAQNSVCFQSQVGEQVVRVALYPLFYGNQYISVWADVFFSLLDTIKPPFSLKPHSQKRSLWIYYVGW